MSKLAVKHALILAAGRGRRLMPFTKDMPKCLVKVGGKPILFYQLRALEMNGVENVTLVTGYLAGEIEKYAEKKFPRFDFKFVHNDRFEDTNDIYSLYLARRHLNGNVLVLDSDVLFHPEIVLKILREEKSAVAFQRAVCGEEEMKVLLGSVQSVLQLSKAMSPALAAGEFMGVSLFQEDFCRELVSALEELIKDGKINIDREAAIEKVIAGGKPLYALDISEYPAIEIDFPEDLKRAEREILPKIISEFE